MKVKSFFLTIIVLWLPIIGFAQNNMSAENYKTLQMQRVYKVFISNETDSTALHKRNNDLVASGANKRGLLAGLGAAIVTGYSNKLIQETVNATSALLGFSVKTLSAWIHKNKNDRNAWLKISESHNHFKQSLNSQVYIDDFYYAPSKSGALDPLNMKFNGFGCMCYMEPRDSNRQRDLPKAPYKHSHDSTNIDSVTDDAELLEFYLSCKLRDDSLGRAHIVNHSKFYVDIDQLVFDTRHTSLPNDSVPMKDQRKFDFRKRKDLTFQITVKVFSSWVNEAIMLTDNQQIGAFDIKARIDSADLNQDGVFVYDPVKHAHKVSVIGDCFLVPRSYTGTADAPSWGTGQYRLELSVMEDCCTNEEWYQIKDTSLQPTKAGNDAGNMQRGKKKVRWDNDKWKSEWKEMQAQGKQQAVWSGAWESVTTAYVGRDWVQELVSPLTNAINEQEKVVLSKLLNVSANSNNSSSSAQSANSHP